MSAQLPRAGLQGKFATGRKKTFGTAQCFPSEETSAPSVLRTTMAQPWNVQIESPDKNDKNGAAIVKVHDKSVVTSGDYQRYFEVDGKRYCHIINPDTLYPAEYVRSVSVICDDSALADALSTTLFNMPIEDGKALIEKTDGCEAVWVDKENNAVYSSGFKNYTDH